MSVTPVPIPAVTSTADEQAGASGLLMIVLAAMLMVVGVIALMTGAGMTVMIIAFALLVAFVGIVVAEIMRMLRDEDDGADLLP